MSELCRHRLELRESQLLAGVPLESVMGLLEACPVRTLKAGEVLLRANQVNRSLYLLLSGHLQVHLDPALDPVAVLNPGEIAGELSVIDGQPTSAQVVAAAESSVLSLDEETLWSLVEASHHVSRNLLLVLSQRLRDGNSVILRTQSLQQEYRRCAVIDALTGVYNRHWLNDTLSRQLEQSRHRGDPLSLLLMDIDGFKRYNDTHGHLAGDRALHAVAATARHAMRPGEMIARYGGDEFVILLPTVGAPGGRRVGERLRDAIQSAKIYSLDRQLLPPVTISIGVAEMNPSDTPESFIASADAALYTAKGSGGNLVGPSPGRI